MHRFSQLHIPTLRNDPADAEAPSHRLLVRGGYARQVGAGLFSFLPLGWRVHQKVVRIIREEMNAIGAQEMLAPVLAPAELWQESGRYDIPELFRLKDRHGRDFVLSLTHEETMTFHARELESYRQLPQLWYHFQTKGRDEARPRAGLLRVREFVMKDSYSFDRDEEGLDVSYWKHAGAYRRIFERCGLRFYECEGDVGLMGGEMAHEYLAPCPAGENEIALCANGDYAANVEAARSVPSDPDFPERLDAPREVETPEIRTIEEVAEFLSVDPRATAKAMPVVGPDEKLVLGLIRGDHRLHELKMAAVLGGEFRPAHPEEIQEAFGASGGSLGPVGVELRVIADEALREGQFVSGANRDGFHLLGVEAGRDYQPEFADIRETIDGDAVHPLRRPDHRRAGDRDRQHLQARHALLGAARRRLSRRERQGAADRDGLLRHRPRPGRGRGDRAEPRRQPNRLAAHDRSLRGRGRLAATPRRRASSLAPRRSPASSPSTATRRCSTIARPARARSSPTPT